MQYHSGDLFSDQQTAAIKTRASETIAVDAMILRRFADNDSENIVAEIHRIALLSPFRHMTVSNGFAMSVAMSNCGEFGWISDRRGYRYSAIDPQTHNPWPAMPEILRDLASRAAAAAGFDRFVPDACLINRYQPGARMSLHQDKDESDFSAPIVSVSLGASATFLFGGAKRGDNVQRYLLQNGDVVVWGGAARLFYHGIAPLKKAAHSLSGEIRYNLTFRKASPM